MLLMRRNGGMGTLADFVRASFPEPNNPIYRPNGMYRHDDGMGSLRDFVDASFPEPMNPLYTDQPTGIRGLGCGCGCSGDCGMGALAVPGWASQLPAPLNDSVGGFPVVYVIGGVIAAAVVLPMILKKGRR